MTTNIVIQAGTDQSPALYRCPWRTRSLIHEDGAQQPNASPPVSFFSKNYSKFRAIFVSLIFPRRPRFWPHAITLMAETLLAQYTQPGRCPALLTACVDLYCGAEVP